MSIVININIRVEISFMKVFFVFCFCGTPGSRRKYIDLPVSIKDFPKFHKMSPKSRKALRN